LALILARAVNWFAQILIMILMARAILSWFSQNPYSPVYRYYMMTVRLTEPFVAPCRKLMGRFNTGMFDFSVLLAFFLIEIVAKIIILIIMNVAY